MIWSQNGDQLLPFEVTPKVDQRRAVVLLARHEGATIRSLWRQVGLAAETADRLRKRYGEAGVAGVAARPRRPHASPRRTPPAVAAAVVALRTAPPTWGGRTRAARLDTRGQDRVPAPRPLTGILHCHDLIDPRHVQARATTSCFMAGSIPSRCAMTTPGSRWAAAPVPMRAGFARDGLPWAILAATGGPWGASHPGAITWREAWGIRVRHGRPDHPQTQGKVARWQRTMPPDGVPFRTCRDVAATQVARDGGRTTSNTARPHEALGMAVPASRDLPRPRPSPAVLPESGDSDDGTVGVVHYSGTISFGGRVHCVSEALRGLPVGVRPTTVDDVRFGDRAIKPRALRQRP